MLSFVLYDGFELKVLEKLEQYTLIAEGIHLIFHAELVVAFLCIINMNFGNHFDHIVS